MITRPKRTATITGMGLDALTQPLGNGVEPPAGDWERGYAKGYDRALSQLVELVEARSHSYVVDDLVRDLADKLRQQARDES